MENVNQLTRTEIGTAVSSAGVYELAAPLGRVFMAAIFLMSCFGKITNFEGVRQSMVAEGMVWTQFFLGGAIIFEIVGGLLLLVGWQTRFAALVLIAFMIPVTLIYHDFWTYAGAAQNDQMIHFLKNLSIMGGLLMVFALGGGAYSLDRRNNFNKT